MEDYRLVAADVFREELNSKRTGEDYTKEQKDALNKIASIVEYYYVNNHIQNPEPFLPEYLKYSNIAYTFLLLIS